MPFAFGHAFRTGDVPAGKVALGAAMDWQCMPLTFWPDGSLKHAIIAGRVASTAGAEAAIALSAGDAATGSALTEADLGAALPATTVAIGSDITSLNALVGTSALHTTVCTGPVMSNWIYRRTVSGSSHLVVYVDVRLYKGGAIEIFPWVENGYLLEANPGNFVRTCAVSINGIQRFSQSIDIKHHTRIPLLSGNNFSYWVGADPGVTPRHDRAYLLATKLVPNLGWVDPPAATLNGLVQSYSPNTLAGDDNATGSAGGRGRVISRPSALYITSGGDARAYRAMMVHALSSGSWSFHFRDATTQLPLSFATYPSIRIPTLGSGTPEIPWPSSSPANTTNHSGGPSPTHLPSYAYFPFIATGRWWFLEEIQFWATHNYTVPTPTNRESSKGLIDASGFTVRGAAWALNCLAQAASLTPVNHPLQAQFKASWEANMAHYRAKYVDGTKQPGWVSPQGFMGEYSANPGSASLYPPPNPTGAWYGAAWQSDYISLVFGYSSDIGIPQSDAALANHLAVRDHAYKQQIGRADDGLNGRYNWRRFGVYGYPIGTDATGLPVETWFTHSQSYAELRSGFGLAQIEATAGLSLKGTNSDSDLAAGTSALTYFSSSFAALSLAAEHNRPGAVEGLARLRGASNFNSATAAYFTDEAPEWGVLPR